MRTKRKHFEIWLFSAVMLALPSVVHAQFTITTNNGDITIMSYAGSGAVIIPGLTNGHPVTTIAANAFAGTSVTSVLIPGSVTSIGSEAFELTSLTSATIPDSVTNLGDEQFYECFDLTNVTIGTNINNIKDYDFFKCSSLTSFTIPGSVTNIATEAFFECTGLTAITLPSSVTNIATGAFEDCSSLLAVYCQGNQPTPNSEAFIGVNAAAKVYYLAGTTGWGAMFDNLPTVLLNPISGIGVHANEFGFTFNGTNNQVIVVEACTNLVNANWQPLQTNTLIGTSTNFTDSQWRNYPVRFYRIGSVP